MSELFTINNLNYKTNERVFFKDFSLKVKNGEYVSIISPNKGGKTLLLKLISAIIPTNNIFKIDNFFLNKSNIDNYLLRIGIVSNDLNSFVNKKVKDELILSLINLGYNDYKINKKLTKISEFFEITNLLNKNINTLDKNTKAKLKIIISLMHEPKLLVLDDAFNDMDQNTKTFMLKKLNILNQDNLTILNITSKIDTIYDSTKIYVLNNFCLEKVGDFQKIINDDTYLRKIGLDIPFVIDLSIKLKFYNLIDNIYFDLEELEEKLWK